MSEKYFILVGVILDEPNHGWNSGKGVLQACVGMSHYHGWPLREPQAEGGCERQVGRRQERALRPRPFCLIFSSNIHTFNMKGNYFCGETVFFAVVKQNT